MCFGRIHSQVKIPPAEVHVEWLKMSLVVDDTEGSIEMDNY